MRLFLKKTHTIWLVKIEETESFYHSIRKTIYAFQLFCKGGCMDHKINEEPWAVGASFQLAGKRGRAKLKRASQHVICGARIGLCLLSQYWRARRVGR